MKTLDAIALTLLIVGGLNWLLVGLFELDLVAMIAGNLQQPFQQLRLVQLKVCAIYCLKFFPMITRKVDERY
ncbi:DUF378 domain-containing protein [Enterococcus faecium]|nr:DUF378 domain-containing protein [Enterococcus faecium]